MLTYSFSIILKLPDQEQSKSPVLNSLTSLNSRRFYDYGIHDFDPGETRGDVQAL